MASMSRIKIARNNLRLQSSFLVSNQLSNQRRAFARSPASALSSRSIVSALQGLNNNFRYGASSTAMFAEMSTNTPQNKVASIRSNSPANSKSSVSNPDIDNAVTKRAYYAGDELLRSKVTIVRTVDEAKVAIEALYKTHGAVHACDTEVMEIDLKEVGPVGNGKVTCLSIYSGPTVRS